MPDSIFVLLIVIACVVYLVARVWCLKSKNKGGCSHGNCGCDIAEKPDLSVKSKESNL